jgi:hypothetical protein
MPNGNFPEVRRVRVARDERRQFEVCGLRAPDPPVVSPSTRSTPKIACSTSPGAFTVGPPEKLGDGARVRWVSGRPGEAPAYAGTDFIIARDGRIAAVYLFFDQLP